MQFSLNLAFSQLWNSKPKIELFFKLKLKLNIFFYVELCPWEMYVKLNLAANRSM